MMRQTNDCSPVRVMQHKVMYFLHLTRKILGRPGALPAGLVQPCPKPRALIHNPLPNQLGQLQYILWSVNLNPVKRGIFVCRKSSQLSQYRTGQFRKKKKCPGFCRTRKFEISESACFSAGFFCEFVKTCEMLLYSKNHTNKTKGCPRRERK